MFSFEGTNDDRFELIIKPVVLNKHATGTLPAFNRLGYHTLSRI